MCSHFPRIIIAKSNFEQFEETAYANPRYFRMNFINGQIEIMPVHNEIGLDQIEARIIVRAGGWCDANPNVIRHYGSQAHYASEMLTFFHVANITSFVYYMLCATL
ncbi:7873_t:CDS:2 [Ambispora leptoticha]|uniref:7873_t:CDS:1 n=1 Tax=Ambispora leptoticha TaxID=144679 RepID=A0A9N8YTC8_9GLOM|nr:7873_t:CDS:2 [Ambispora leptoticha]